MRPHDGTNIGEVGMRGESKKKGSQSVSQKPVELRAFNISV